ncbi:hypothetical protein OUZ56_014311 [Daphnia magna]|uniref:Uncharacterized protein n=1 Tax=Daphnia magna TaxID=35525 RepID=A0ABR0AJD1_9CRUS|nr:hypothetical protein OUZ56_014311 [Daphnia magna]
MSLRAAGGKIVKYLTRNRLLFLLCRDERKKRVRVQEKGCCPADGGSIDKLKVNNPTECTRRRFLYSGANTEEEEEAKKQQTQTKKNGPVEGCALSPLAAIFHNLSQKVNKKSHVKVAKR